MDKQENINTLADQQEQTTTHLQYMQEIQRRNTMISQTLKYSGKHKECLQKARNRRSWTPHLSGKKSPLRHCEIIHYSQDYAFDIEIDCCDVEILDILRRSEDDIVYSEEEFYCERRSCNIFFD